jgi:hypothetical protein
MKYTCSECGGTETLVSAARPSIDDRYAVGYCSSCTYDRSEENWHPVAKTTAKPTYKGKRKTSPWKTVQLCRSDGIGMGLRATS